MFVANILARKKIQDIFTIKSNNTLAEAAEKLSEKRIGVLIVRDGEEAFDGIISERDIVREIGKRGTTCMSDHVGDVMTKTVMACQPTDSVQSIMKKMSEGRFRHLPVVDGANLIGVVSIGDAVASRLQELELENDAMAGMIAGNT